MTEGGASAFFLVWALVMQARLKAGDEKEAESPLKNSTPLYQAVKRLGW